MTERLTLPNGDWVDLVDRMNYAQRRRIMAASGTPDIAGEGVAALIVNWSLRGLDDQPIPFPGADVDGIPSDALYPVPADVFDLIAEKAVSIFNGPDPKGSSETSPSSQPDEASPSLTNSQTHTSSPTILAGRTKASSQPPPA